MKKIISVVLAFALLLVSQASVTYAADRNSDYLKVYISKDDYYDKTLAMIIGQCAGVTTGYEYCHIINSDGSIDKTRPWVGMPDDAFLWMNGTLGGGTYTREYSWATRIPEAGVILNDDDLTIDFFTQHIISEHGPAATYEDFKYEWLDHDVRDFGGGDYAKRLMENLNISANNAGKYEYGNACYWLTESYIGYESLGSNFPGMPATAIDFANTPISMVSDTDSSIWGKWWVAMYANAYFSNDVRSVLTETKNVFPNGSHPKAVYEKCIQLHEQFPNDWRTAATEIVKCQYPIYLLSMMNSSDRDPTINNAFAILAILYGNNDYTETLKIAALAGYDGDCTAAGIGGLMGIIKGMNGTPAIVKEKVYANGSGVYRNEQYMARIGDKYPNEQKLTDIALLYQHNTEAMLTYYGSEIDANGYYITLESLPESSYIEIENADFEDGTLLNWNTWSSTGNGSFFAECQQEIPGAYTASSGYYKGTAITSSETETAKLWVTVDNLEPNCTYRVDAQLRSPVGREVRLYAENYGGSYVYTSAVTGCGGYWPVLYGFGETDCWAHRYITFTTGAHNTSAEIGLHLPASSSDAKWGNIDNLSIQKVGKESADHIEAETGLISNAAILQSDSASSCKYIQVKEQADSNLTLSYDNSIAGEKCIRIYYANGDKYALQSLTINGHPCSNILYPATGSWGKFSQNFTEIYVPMAEGMNTIVFAGIKGAIEIDSVEIIHHKDTDDHNYYAFDKQHVIDGGIYQIIPSGGSAALTVDGFSLNNGANVKTEENHFSHNQKWQFLSCGEGIYYIKNIGTTKMLDVSGGSVDNNANVNQWEQNYLDCQKWAIEYLGNGEFSIRAVHSGKYLSEQADGNVVQADCAEGTSKWRLTFLPAEDPIISGATYMLRSAKNGKYVDVEDGSQYSGANIVQKAKSNADSQMWIITRSGHWKYSFASVASGKMLEVKAEKKEKGAPLGIWDATGRENQQWQLSQEYGGCFKIISADSGKVIDIPGGSSTENTALWQWDFFDYGGEHQNWFFELVALPQE